MTNLTPTKGSGWQKLMLSLVGILVIHGLSFAQCNGHFTSRTYDTLLTGPGYGNYTVSLPQWNPDSGQLISVKVNAQVSVQYAFTLKNVDVSPSVYTLKVGREDYYTTPVDGVIYDTVVERQIGAYSLSPGASVTQASFSFMDKADHIDSTSGSVVAYLGRGRVSFAYSPVTYTTLRSSNNSSYSYNAVASDQIHFSITYQYCPNVVLAARVTDFTAALKDPMTSILNWAVVNELKGMSYEIQRSSDGNQFSTVGIQQWVGANGGSYQYLDPLPPGSGDTWYYRLKVHGPDSIFYTQVRIVTRPGRGGGGDLIVYPNPADDHINVDLPRTGGGGRWVIDVIAADGKRILTRSSQTGGTVRILFERALAKGVYFVRASNDVDFKAHCASFIAK